MRYHLIANRQPIIGCLFLFLFVSACRQSASNRTIQRVESRAVQIEYAGDQSLEQADFIQINGKLFWHDSLYVFHRKSTDTFYLPTQRFIADQPPGGRPVYSNANALSTLISMSQTLLTSMDSTKYKLDLSRIHLGQLRIESVGKESVEVVASESYPLRITAIKN